MSRVWGIDPDSSGFPLAVYEDGKLVDLRVVGLVDFVRMFMNPELRPDLMVIEDVNANSGLYARLLQDHSPAGRKKESKIAQRVGMCKQMQNVAQMIAGEFGVPQIAMRPTKHNWAGNKSVFEAATGWAGRSNKDTRSAAYFGWQHRHWRVEK